MQLNQYIIIFSSKYESLDGNIQEHSESEIHAESDSELLGKCIILYQMSQKELIPTSMIGNIDSSQINSCQTVFQETFSACLSVRPPSTL